MKKVILIIALVSALVMVSTCAKRQPSVEEAEEGQCTLEFTAVKSSESIPSLIRQYQFPITKKPSQLKDLPEGLSADCKYFIAKLADKDVPVILDSPENIHDSVLYVDTDGDGHLLNEKCYAAKPTEERGVAYRYGPILFEFDEAQSKVKTEFYVVTRRGRYLTFYPAGYQVGTIHLGKKSYKVAVIDGNFDGRYDKFFSPPVKDFYRPQCDLFAIDRNGDNKLSWNHLEVMPVSRMVRLGRSRYNTVYYNISITADGSSLEFKKVEPEFGTLDLGGAHVQFQLWSDAARQMLSGPHQKTWQLPAGKYIASPIEFRHVDTSGYRWIFRSSEVGSLKDFEIKPGETTAFRIGPPFSIKTSVQQRDGSALIGFNLEGQAGELYRPGARKGRATIPAPKFKIIDEAGKVIGSGQFEYG